MKSKIILLYEPEQIKRILSCFGKDRLAKEFSLIALEYDVESLLKQCNIPYFSLEEHLRPDSFSMTHANACDYVRKLYNFPGLNFLNYSDIPLLEVKGPYLLHYIKQILYYMEIMDCVLNNHTNVNEIIIPESYVFMPETAGRIASFTVKALEDVVKLVGKQKKIFVSVIPAKKKRATVTITRSLINRIVSFLFELAFFFVNQLISFFKKKKEIRIFVADHWRNVKPFIEKMNNVELVMMERKQIKAVGWKIWKNRTRFYRPRDFINSEIKKIALEQQEVMHKKWLDLDTGFEFSKKFIYKGFSFWPLIHQILYNIIEYQAKDIISEIEGLSNLFTSLSINRILLRTSSKNHFYIASKLSFNLKIPSIELQHGLIDAERTFIYYSPVKVDYFASYGKLTKEILIRDNNDPQKIIEVGSPRFDNYLNVKPKSLSLTINPFFPVVLFIPPAARTSIKPRPFTSYDTAEIFQVLADLQQEIKGLQVILKLRPTSIKERFYMDLAKEIFKDNAIIAQYEDMKSLIYLSNVVVSCKSTVVLEAMIIGKPVIVFTTVRDPISQFQWFEKSNAIKVSRSLNQFLNISRSLINDQKAQKKLVENADVFLKKNYMFDGKSSSRISQILNNN